jgi:hypothetical protein
MQTSISPADSIVLSVISEEVTMPLKWPGECKNLQVKQISAQPLLVKRVPTWLELLFDGDHDLVKICLGVAAMTCSGIVTAAWDADFPTDAERYIWIACSLFTIATGFWTAVRFAVRLYFRWEVFRCLPVYVQNPLLWIALGEYMFSRAYFILEFFISIWKLPWAAYQRTNWTVYIPHL